MGAARARQSFDPRRSAPRRHEGSPQSENQAARIVPAVRSLGAARGRLSVVRDGGGSALHDAGASGARREARPDSRRDARRRLGTTAHSDAGGQSALPPADRGCRDAHRRADAAEHLIQRERTGGLPPRGGARLLPAHADGPAGDGRLGGPSQPGRRAVKLIFANRYFYPDISATSQLLSDLAFRLARQGREVHVVASRQRYGDADADLPASEVREGLHIHRVWTSSFGRAFLPGRVLDYFFFYLFAGLRIPSLARRGDLVIAMTDPPLLSFPAALAAA